ncbi:hypothetical protein HPB47_022439 [Ixodes persulcatus]|uniref:Uncharacterized protein n=1 Tax=Ixodes persulcatus TaxID=34615 RepID=A0AC60Q9V6_IXOPE|nr:hypothetical protein HPB47_022439 [Ixodes persulcatus]
MPHELRGRGDVFSRHHTRSSTTSKPGDGGNFRHSPSRPPDSSIEFTPYSSMGPLRDAVVPKTLPRMARSDICFGRAARARSFNPHRSSTGTSMTEEKTSSLTGRPFYRCNVGYQHSKEKASLFRAPKDAVNFEKWDRAIPRADKRLQPNSAVCERHFDKSSVSVDGSCPGFTAYTFDGLLVFGLLLICTCAYMRRVPRLKQWFLSEKKGFFGVFYKASVIGTRLHLLVSLTCVAAGFYLLFVK